MRDIEGGDDAHDVIAATDAAQDEAPVAAEPSVGDLDEAMSPTIAGAAFFFQPTAKVPEEICCGVTLNVEDIDHTSSLHLPALSRIVATWSCKPMDLRLHLGAVPPFYPRIEVID